MTGAFLTSTLSTPMPPLPDAGSSGAFDLDLDLAIGTAKKLMESCFKRLGLGLVD